MFHLPVVLRAVEVMAELIPQSITKISLNDSITFTNMTLVIQTMSNIIKSCCLIPNYYYVHTCKAD